MTGQMYIVQCVHVTEDGEHLAEVLYLNDRQALGLCFFCLETLRNAIAADLLEEGIRRFTKDIFSQRPRCVAPEDAS